MNIIFALLLLHCTFTIETVFRYMCIVLFIDCSDLFV